MNLTKYFIGQTRFSIYSPESNAWNISGFSENDYIAHLYSDERLLLRMKIFIDYSLPLLEQMKKNYLYTHIVSYSSNLPEKWKKCLFDAANKYQFIFLHEVDTYLGNPIYNILHKQNKGMSVAYFRLDDDDLLSINYLDQLAHYNNIAFKNMAISFNKGVVAHFNKSYVDLRVCNKQFLAIGQAYIGSFINGVLEIPLNLSHHNLDSQIPVILDSREFTYLWTLHDEQDSNHRKNMVKVIDQLAGYSTIKEDMSVEKYFPSIKTDINNFILNRNVKILNKMNLNSYMNYISIDCSSDIYEVNCSFETDIKVNLLKSLVVAFDFEEDVDEIIGLTKSGNNNISWYKYVNFYSGKSNISLNITLNRINRLKGIKIFIWDEKISNLILNKLEVIYY